MNKPHRITRRLTYTFVSYVFPMLNSDDAASSALDDDDGGEYISAMHGNVSATTPGDEFTNTFARGAVCH